MKTKIFDGKKFIFKSKRNLPDIKTVRDTYKRIPDDKKVPVVFQTKKSYVKDYIKSQEKIRGIDFSKSEEKRYMREELKNLAPVTSRFTTYHNKYISPRTVFFTDNKVPKEIIKDNIYHEYGHEVWEKKRVDKKWNFARKTSPTYYGKSDKEEDFCDSFALYKRGLLNDNSRNKIIKDYSKDNMYHGTSSNVLNQIQRDKELKTNNNKLYLTNDKKYAKLKAEQASLNDNSKPVIIEVDEENLKVQPEGRHFVSNQNISNIKFKNINFLDKNSLLEKRLNKDNSRNKNIFNIDKDDRHESWEDDEYVKYESNKKIPKSIIFLTKKEQDEFDSIDISGEDNEENLSTHFGFKELINVREEKFKLNKDISKDSIPISQAKYLTVYHGTKKEFIPHIKKYGLVPNTSLTPSLIVANRHAFDGPENFEPTKVGLSNDFKEPNEMNPVVLKVKVLKNKLEYQKNPFEAASQFTKDKSTWKSLNGNIYDFKSIYEVRNKEQILPNNIKVIDYKKAEKLESIKEEEIENKEWDEDFRKRSKPGTEFDSDIENLDEDDDTEFIEELKKEKEEFKTLPEKNFRQIFKDNSEDKKWVIINKDSKQRVNDKIFDTPDKALKYIEDDMNDSKYLTMKGISDYRKVNCKRCGKIVNVPVGMHFDGLCKHCMDYLENEDMEYQDKLLVDSKINNDDSKDRILTFSEQSRIQVFGKTCPNCGAKVEKNIVICPSCGYNFISEDVAENKRKRLTTRAELVHKQMFDKNLCPHCKQVYNKDLSYCSNCGIDF